MIADGRNPASLAFAWLGRQGYMPMWEQMRQRADAVAEGAADEIVWSCEHDAVYTTGRRGIDNRIAGELPAALIQTDRGGETTFHGPGQIMLYPVVHLRRRELGVRDYVHLLEQSCIDLLADLGIVSGRRDGFPGVWAEEGKVAALGVRVSRGVALHGMALNVDVDDRWFAAIDPCGLGLPAVNLSDILEPPPLSELAHGWYASFDRLLR